MSWAAACQCMMPMSSPHQLTPMQIQTGAPMCGLLSFLAAHLECASFTSLHFCRSHVAVVFHFFFFLNQYTIYLCITLFLVASIPGSCHTQKSISNLSLIAGERVSEVPGSYKIPGRGLG